MKAAVFVTARGNAMATALTVGLGGVVGAVAVDKATAGPGTPAKGQLGYLALFELRFTDGAHSAFDVGRAFSGSPGLARAPGSTME